MAIGGVLGGERLGGGYIEVRTTGMRESLMADLKQLSAEAPRYGKQISDAVNSGAMGKGKGAFLSGFVDGVKQAMDEAAGEAERGSKKVGDALAAPGKSSKGVYDQIGAEAKRATTGVTGHFSSMASSVNQRVAGMGASFASMGKNMAAGFGVVSLVQQFGAATEAASDLSETISKSGVIWKDNAAAMEQWSNSSAQAMGMSKNAALGAAAQFGDMFQQMGYNSQGAMDMSKSIVQMTADFASFHNQNPAEVQEMIAGAFRGEYDSIQRILPGLSSTAVEQQALAETGKKTAKALTDQEKAHATLSIMQRDGAAAMGDFARTSDGVANRQRIAAAESENLKAKIGAGLQPVMLSFLEIGGRVTGVLGDYADILPTVIGLAAALTVGVWALNTAFWANPVFWVVAGIAALGVAIAVAWTRWEGFRNVVTGVWNAIYAAGQFVVNWFMASAWPVIQNVGQWIGEKFLWLWGSVIQPVAAWVWGAIQNVAGVISWLWGAVVQPVLGFVGGAFQLLWGVVSWFVQTFWAGIQLIAGVVSWLWASIVGPVLSWIGDKFNWLYTYSINPILSLVMAVIRATAAAIGWLWSGIVGPVLSWIGDKFGWLYNAAISPALNRVGDVIRGAANVINWLWNSIVNPVLGWIGDKFVSAVDIIRNAWDKIREVVRAPVKWVVDVVINNGLIGAYNQIAGVFETFGAKKIPTIDTSGWSSGGYTGYGPWSQPAGIVHYDEHVTQAWARRDMEANYPGLLDAINTHGSRALGYADGGRVRWNNEWLDPTTAAILSAAGNSVGGFWVTQGSWSTRVGASGSTHAGAGVADVSPLNGDWQAAENALRAAGAVAWWRHPSQGPWPDHIHMISPGSQGLSPAAAAQLADFARGGDGLGGKDSGGVIGSLIDILLKPFDVVADTVSNLVSGIAGGPDGPFAKIVGGMPRKAVETVREAIKTAIGQAPQVAYDGAAGEGGAGGSGVQQWAGVAAQAMALAGLPQQYLPLLLKRMNVESGGNPNAQNNWDINAQNGVPSQGLMQTIQPTFDAYAGDLRSRGIRDPLANIYAAIRYTLSRYGIGGIEAAWGGTKGYDSGGWLMPGATLAVNNSGRPEPILTAAQWDAMNAGGLRDGQEVALVVDGASFRAYVQTTSDARLGEANRRVTNGRRTF